MRNLGWISLIVSSTVLFGSERIELFGKVMEVNASAATATKNPVLIYKDQILSADQIVYDRNSSTVELNGSVSLFKGQQYYTKSEHMRVDLLNDKRYSHPYYGLDHSSGLWMSTDEATSCKNEIDLLSGAVSGCDSSDPLWKIRFSSADYDTESMWVNLYNARIEIGNFPLFYLPYFGYPTDRTRRSGLLIPTLGWSNTEGFYYQQPIYFAPRSWWDLELTPQIRMNRGEGVYGDFRFVDSPVSKGYVKFGLFNEQNGYVAEHNLAHNKHYGYELFYQNSEFLRQWFGSDLEGESGLYVDGRWMNDVDYLNLRHTNELHNVISNQAISRINGYYSHEQDYFGAYFKYSQYLNLASNAQTIQTLPTVQYHRYLESFLQDKLLVNADATVTNLYRPNGIRAVESDMNIPLLFQTSLLNDYMNMSYTANARARMIGFYGTDNTANSYSNGRFAQLDHELKIESMLIRQYDGFTHVLNPDIVYSSSGNRFYKGYYETYQNTCNQNNTGAPCEFYTISEPSNSLGFGLNNYLFEGGKQVFVDRLSQNYRYDQYGSYSGELQNELEWTINSGWSYYNQSSFNHDRNRITKEQNTLRYNDEIIAANMSHYYTDILSGNQINYTSYVTADASYRYGADYRFSGLIAYDYHNSLLKRGEIGFLHSQRCLDFGLKFVQNRQPIATNVSANDSVANSYIFITIILKPIGGSGFNYKLTNN
ncbi:MAG: LPS-assembly protein LptD [Sulfuricurvum sp.]|nr:LPS-assembly protein LptD [Sulfuricurvum sp.]